MKHDACLQKVRRAKVAGCSARAVWEVVEGTALAAARAQGWRPSELAASLADWKEHIVKVYGRKATARLF